MCSNLFQIFTNVLDLISSIIIIKKNNNAVLKFILFLWNKDCELVKIYVEWIFDLIPFKFGLGMI